MFIFGAIFCKTFCTLRVLFSEMAIVFSSKPHHKITEKVFFPEALYKFDFTSLKTKLLNNISSGSNGIVNHNHLFRKWTLNHLAKLAKRLNYVVSTYLYGVYYYHVTYAFPSESTLYSCLNVKVLLARNRRGVRSLSDGNWIRIHNHLVRKSTVDHLVKLVKWLSCVLSTYLYCTFDCRILLCYKHVSE